MILPAGMRPDLGIHGARINGITSNPFSRKSNGNTLGQPDQTVLRRV